MKTNPKLPLDSDDIVKQQMVKNIKQSKSLLNYLEIIPIVILIAGVYLQRQSHPYWSEIILLGAGIAGFLYLFFSWFLFRVGDYRSSELTLSVLAGFFLSLGMLGMAFYYKGWSGADLMVQIGMWGSLGLFSCCTILFITHLKDERASIFYRNILARLLVFTAILFRLYPL